MRPRRLIRRRERRLNAGVSHRMSAGGFAWTIGGLLWAYFIYVTARRLLWRLPVDLTERRVSVLGVRGFGLSFWVFMGFVVGWADYTQGPGDWRLLATMMYVMFPISLWAGWAWGKGMSVVFREIPRRRS